MLYFTRGTEVDGVFETMGFFNIPVRRLGAWCMGAELTIRYVRAVYQEIVSMPRAHTRVPAGSYQQLSVNANGKGVVERSGYLPVEATSPSYCNFTSGLRLKKIQTLRTSLFLHQAGSIQFASQRIGNLHHHPSKRS